MLHDGTILVVVEDNRIVALTPKATSGLPQFMAKLFYGGKMNADCGTGIVRGSANAASVKEGLSSSLSLLCPGKLSAIAAKASCTSDQKKSSIAFPQSYGEPVGASSIVHLASGC